MSEEDIIEELRTSYEKYGPVRKVVRTQFGIAAGETRKKAVSEWPEKTIDVKNYYDHLKLKVADNLHKRKEPEWWVRVLKDAATELLKQEVEKGQIVSRLETDFPLSKRSIYVYLPQEFKQPTGPKGPREEIAATAISHEKPEKKESTVKLAPVNTSPRRSDNVKSSYTDAEMSLINHLGKAGIKYKTQEPYERPGEFNSEGKPKSYIIDVLVDEDHLGLEVEGRGTSSDNPVRDQFFKERGITIVHLPNAMVLDYGDVVATLVALITR